jgi:hypothetical protein
VGDQGDIRRRIQGVVVSPDSCCARNFSTSVDLLRCVIWQVFVMLPCPSNLRGVPVQCIESNQIDHQRVLGPTLTVYLLCGGVKWAVVGVRVVSLCVGDGQGCCAS